METGSLKFAGENLTLNGVEITFGGSDAPDTPVAQRNAKYATATEDGEHRFRRLLTLGYV